MMPLRLEAKCSEWLLIVGLLSVLCLPQIDNATIAQDASEENLNENSNNTQATNSTTRRTVHFLANHRMENSDGTYERNDRLASDSILRPQLAVQIFTHPAGGSNPDGQSQIHVNGKPIGSYNQFNEQRQLTAANSRRVHEKLPSIEAINSNKLEPWRYETDQASSSANLRDSYTGHEAASVSPNGVGGPLINAIITVPGSGSEQNNGNDPATGHHSTVDELTQGSSSANVEQAISNLLDNQATGNIEFSMNLNGEDIVINPVNKNASGGFNSTSSRISFGGENTRGQLRRIKDIRRHDQQDQTVSKSLRKHVASELAGDEQSASEIDLIDGSNDDGDNDPDFEPSKSSARDDESPSPKLKDIDAEIEKDHRNSPHRQWTAASPSESEPSGNSRPHGRRETKNRQTSKISDNYDEDEKKSASNHWASESGSGGGKKKAKNNSRKDDNGQVIHRKTAGSKRRSTFKASNERESTDAKQRDDRVNRNQESASMVTINGEDVKRFEKLLEDLRSLSLKNLSDQRVKRLSKSSSRISPVTSTQKSAANEGEDDDGSYGKVNDDSELPPNNDPSEESPKSSFQGSRSPTGKRPISSESRVAGNGCEGKKSRPSTQRFEESNLVSDTELSPNSADQDTITGDITDELNDESSQNVEQEDQLNRMDTADSNRLQTNDAYVSKSPAQTEDQPATLLVRKTVLQNYYDSSSSNNINNGNPSVEPNEGGSQGANDDLESIHQSQHDIQHQKNTLSEEHATNESEMQPPQQLHPRQQSYSLQSHRQVAETPSPLNNYIDYSRLDDREVYRGSESQKFRVSVRPKAEMDRMRSLQQVLERAAMEINSVKKERS